MGAYASRIGRDPEATYRQIDAAGRTGEADPHALVQVLYEELVRALRVIAWAAEHRQLRVRSEKATRAIAILFALESGLDFERGGEVSKTLARLYQGARQTVINASLGHDPAPFVEVADNIEEIAEAWRQVRGG